MLKTLKKNVVNTFGKRGADWLKNLPSIIKTLQNQWNLQEIHPINNMSYHFVATAIDSNNRAVVIKVGCDKDLTTNEAKMLKYFKNYGAIDLFDFSKKNNALLLKQAIDGKTLKSLYPKHIDFVIDIYANIIKQIDNNPLLPASEFQPIDLWLKVIDKVSSTKIDKKLLEKAIELKSTLLNSMKNPKLLHGDLHLDNILRNNENWLFIDPKGIVGEIEFEIANFDIFSKSEIKTANSKIFQERIEKIALKTTKSYQRIRDWIFVRLILSAAWYIESFENPETELKLANLLYKIL